MLHPAPDVYSPEFYGRQKRGSLTSAQQAVPVLMDLLRPPTVIDVGCGIGTWAACFRARGVDVLGVDGEWVRASELQIPESSFVPVDLRQCALTGQIEGVSGKYSLCVSLEVAEHLPPHYADGFVSLLTRLSDIVLFSAAIPHQGGAGHLNEQWCTYWIKKFQDRGYVASDVLRVLLWDDEKVLPWYKQNMILYIQERSFPSYRDEIQELMNSCGDEPMSKVHPDFLTCCVDYYHSPRFVRTLDSGTLVKSLMGRIYTTCRRQFLHLLPRGRADADLNSCSGRHQRSAFPRHHESS